MISSLWVREMIVKRDLIIQKHLSLHDLNLMKRVDHSFPDTSATTATLNAPGFGAISKARVIILFILSNETSFSLKPHVKQCPPSPSNVPHVRA